MIRFGAIHAAARRPFQPWKNGGGETAEIICQPEGAGFDDFHWRISTAKVASSGPFSIFPGVARVLTVLQGGPMLLRFDGGAEIIASVEAGPIGFPGDIACQAELTGPPVLDLNVMARAPFTARTIRPDQAEDAPIDLVARLFFATRALPEHGLALHDLAEVTDLPAADLRNLGLSGWLIEIARPRG